MEIEIALLAIGVSIVAVERGYKLYKKYMADGKITLDEVLEIAEMAKDLPSLSQVKKMKKAELVALCEEHGIDADGVKADLIARLEKGLCCLDEKTECDC